MLVTIWTTFRRQLKAFTCQQTRMHKLLNLRISWASLRSESFPSPLLAHTACGAHYFYISVARNRPLCTANAMMWLRGGWILISNLISSSNKTVKESVSLSCIWGNGFSIVTKPNLLPAEKKTLFKPWKIERERERVGKRGVSSDVCQHLVGMDGRVSLIAERRVTLILYWAFSNSEWLLGKNGWGIPVNGKFANLPPFPWQVLIASGEGRNVKPKVQMSWQNKAPESTNRLPAPVTWNAAWMPSLQHSCLLRMEFEFLSTVIHLVLLPRRP